MKHGDLRAKLFASFMAFGGLAMAQASQAAQDASAPAPAEADNAKVSQAMDNIIVVGNRYQASKAQIKATNTVNILSAEDLSHTAVHNVAEALALLPAISTTNTGTGFIGGVDAASRGEAMYAQVRGMDTSYAINLMNGVNVAESNPYTRSVQLNLLPPSGLSTIVVNLTSSPDQESDFISGLIDYHTPSAFDFSPTHFSMTVGAKLESEALAYGSNKIGQNIALEGSKRFGSNDQFGVYAGAYYDTRYFTNGKISGLGETGCCDFGWGYAIQSGTDSTGAPTSSNNSAPGVNPIHNLELTGMNESVAVGQTERYGGSLSLDWRPNDDTTFYAKMTMARADTIDNIANSQIVGQGDGNIYNGQNGKAQGNQGLAIGNTGNYQMVIPDVSLRYWFITNPQVDTLGTAQVGGETKFGHLTVASSVFFSTGVDNMPNQIQVATRNQDNGGAGTTFGGTQLFSYNSNNFPIPLLSQSQFNILNNIPGMPAGQAPERTEYLSQEQLAGGKADFKYSFDNSFLQFVKFGVKYLEAWHQSSSVDYQIGGNTTHGNEPSSYTTFASLGLISGTFKHAVPGLYSQSVPNLNEAAIQSLYFKLAADPTVGVQPDDCGGVGRNPFDCNTTKTREKYGSAYVMANLKFGDLEITPGLRYEDTKIHNTYFIVPPEGEGNFEGDQASESKLLPSIYFNYRPNPRAVYRFGVWDSYIRPPFVELGGGESQSTSTDSSGNKVTVIKKGNPKLKPVSATNVDVSGEWDSGAGGHLMVQGYYKAIRDYLYDAGTSAGNYVQTGSAFSQLFVPENGGTGSTVGFDVEVRQKFQGLPAPFDGLGVWGNFTRQYTSVNLGSSFATPNFKDHIANSPGVLANAGIFYQKDALSIDMNYNYQGAAVQTYDWFNRGNSGDDVWTSPVGRLDLHVGYSIIKNLKIDFSVSNLTNATTYFAHVGKNSYAIADAVLSGTTGVLNLTYKY